MSSYNERDFEDCHRGPAAVFPVKTTCPTTEASTTMFNLLFVNSQILAEGTPFYRSMEITFKKIECYTEFVQTMGHRSNIMEKIKVFEKQRFGRSFGSGEAWVAAWKAERKRAVEDGGAR